MSSSASASSKTLQKGLMPSSPASQWHSRREIVKRREIPEARDTANRAFGGVKTSSMEYAIQGTRMDISEQQVWPHSVTIASDPPRQSKEEYLRSRSKSPERGQSRLAETSADSLQTTDDIVRSLGAQTIASHAPDLPARISSQRLNNLRKRMDRSFPMPSLSHQQQLEVAAPSDESEIDLAIAKASRGGVVFNSPRTCRGQYSTPAVVNLLSSLSDRFPTTSPLIAAFHSVKLSTEKTHASTGTDGVYLRASHKVKKTIAQNHDQDPALGEKGALAPDAAEDVTAVDLFARSIVTQHLIGRSTWDRVVGMHSEFARSLIASRLKDTRLVFIVNTAGSREHTAPSLQPPRFSPAAPMSPTLRPPTFQFFIGDDSFPTLPSSELPSCPAATVESTVATELPSGSDPFLGNLASSGQLHLKTHQPTTPKPSFSPRKRSGVRCSPAVLVPLT
jgi:hypothetical protein